MGPMDLIQNQANLDRLYVREILASFFGDRFAEQVPVDDRVIRLVAEMLTDPSIRPDWVAFMSPRLRGPSEAVSTDALLTQIRKIGKRLIAHPALKMTLASRKTQAWKFRPRLLVAVRDI